MDIERIALTTQVDLTEASYEAACEQLIDACDAQYGVWPTLKVSIWDSNIAIQIAANFQNCDVDIHNIHIAQDYRKDEWSVKYMNYKKKKYYEIYSEGA